MTKKVVQIRNNQLLWLLLCIPIFFWILQCNSASTDEPNDSISNLPPSNIGIVNLTSSDTVNYQLLFIRGTVMDTSHSVIVQNPSYESDERSWPVYNMNFTCLTYLSEGKNKILISTPVHKPDTLVINYLPPENVDYRVRIVYLLSSDGDGSFQEVIPGAPHDLQTAVDRLNFDALMVQTAYAEMIYNSGHKRTTFQIQKDTDGDNVFVERLNLTTDQLNNYRLVCSADSCADGPTPYHSTYDLWGKVSQKMSQYSRNATTKNLVYTAFTRFVKNDSGSILYAGATLGGGNTGLVEGNSLYLIPGNIDELQERMYDNRMISQFDMDSYGDSPLWLAYFTALGGACHELGHSFGLAHSNEEYGLMGLGFYNFQHLFMPVNGDLTSFPLNELPFFAKIDIDGGPQISKLMQSPFFNY